MLIDKDDKYKYIPYLAQSKFLKQAVDEILEDMKNGESCFLYDVVKAQAEENTKLKAKLIAVDDFIEEQLHIPSTGDTDFIVDETLRQIRKAMEGADNADR